MSDIAAFVHARLDEIEKAARAATLGPWVASGRWVWSTVRPDAVFGVDGDPADAAYIARRDPARVLAEVEALRRIVDEFAGEGNRTAVFVLRVLAAIWRDHPDYDPAWAPDET